MSTPAPADQTPRRRANLSGWLVPGLLLALILALGAWLRWRYLRDVSLFIDEFTTLWAAKQVQARGFPIMPSGVLYTRGLLATYVEAAALALGGFSFAVGRFPSLIFGLLSIGAVFAVGRRGWRTAVGLIAALGLALLPEAVLWGGRARFYAQFQFLTILLLWATWEAIRERAQEEGMRPVWRRWLLVAGLFAPALFTQEQTLLLYPAMLLSIVLWQGPRGLSARPVIVANALIVATLIVRYVVEIVGQPGYFETIQATRPYVGFVFDLWGALRSYAPLFGTPGRVPWTIGGTMAGVVALLLVWRGRSLRALSPFHQTTLFYSLHLLWVVFVIFALVGTSWRDPRYLFFVQPIWLLLGAAGVVWLVERLGFGEGSRGGLLLTAALGLLLAAALVPGALRTIGSSVEAWDRALEKVAAERGPADVVLSPQPPACALMLGRCDYYALQRGYEEYVVLRDGEPVDRWSGAPLLNTTEQLTQVVATAPATWFVSDAFRLATRYEGDFLRILIEQFDPVVEEQGVLGLRAAGRRELPALGAARSFTPTLPFGPLQLHALRHSDPAAGSPLDVELLWSARERVSTQINTSIRVVDSTGAVVAQEDGPPARGIIPTTLFFDTPLPDRKTPALPADLPDGRYRIDVAAYAVEGGEPQGEVQPSVWFRLGDGPTSGEAAPLAEWQNGLHLMSHVPHPIPPQPGEQFTFALVWQADRRISQSLTAFLQLLDENGVLLAQDDRQPEGGFYPTWAWQPGEAVPMTFTLTLPESGQIAGARFVTGWYDAATGERVRLGNGEDVFLLLGPLP